MRHKFLDVARVAGWCAFGFSIVSWGFALATVIWGTDPYSANQLEDFAIKWAIVAALMWLVAK